MATRQKKVCFLCNSNTSISFHSFPKNPSQRFRWMKICRLDSSDDLTNVRICGNHFSESDFCIRSRGIRKIRFLRPGAQPSRNINGSFLLPKYNVQGSINSNNSVSFGNYKTPGQPFLFTEIREPISLQEPVREKEHLSVFRDEIPTLCSSKRSHLLRPARKNQESSSQILRKKMLQQKLEIQGLQQQNKHLMRKIGSLKQLMEHLKSQNVISLDAYEQLIAKVVSR